MNKIIKLWHLETGELLESINFDDPICCVIKLNDDLIGFWVIEFIGDNFGRAVVLVESVIKISLNDGSSRITGR